MVVLDACGWESEVWDTGGATVEVCVAQVVLKYLSVPGGHSGLMHAIGYREVLVLVEQLTIVVSEGGAVVIVEGLDDGVLDEEVLDEEDELEADVVEGALDVDDLVMSDVEDDVLVLVIKPLELELVVAPVIMLPLALLVPVLLEELLVVEETDEQDPPAYFSPS